MSLDVTSVESKLDCANKTEEDVQTSVVLGDASIYAEPHSSDRKGCAMWQWNSAPLQ